MNINNINGTVTLQDFCDLDNLSFFMYVADITPEELFNMFFGGFGGATMSGGKKAFSILCTCIPAFMLSLCS